MQSEKFVEAHGGPAGDVSVYGQESNPATWRLARLNLATPLFNRSERGGDSLDLPLSRPAMVNPSPAPGVAL